VKFIVDAQLPVKLAVALTGAGHDAVHTLNLPDENRSRDLYITRLADSEGRVVISKDGDFVTSHIVHGSPLRLLQISTGNMPNSIHRRHPGSVGRMFESYRPTNRQSKGL